MAVFVTYARVVFVVRSKLPRCRCWLLDRLRADYSSAVCLDGTLMRKETSRGGGKLGLAAPSKAQGKPIKTEVYWNEYVYDAK